MNIHQQLYYIQHKLIPWLFYKCATCFRVDLLHRGGELFIDFLNYINADDPDFRCPFTQSDFLIEEFPIENYNGSILRINMPKPTQMLQCRQVFLAYTSDFERCFYFTLELNQANEYFLCGWGSEHMHLSFDFDQTDSSEEVLTSVKNIFASSTIENARALVKAYRQNLSSINAEDVTDRFTS